MKELAEYILVLQRAYVVGLFLVSGVRTYRTGVLPALSGPAESPHAPSLLLRYCSLSPAPLHSSQTRHKFLFFHFTS
jgi:hypothetical protein